jgi:hypothetical protein
LCCKPLKVWKNQQIAQPMGLTPEKMALTNRFLQGGMAALEEDAPPRRAERGPFPVSDEKAVEMTIGQRPANAMHWSTRTSEASVRRTWRAYGPNLQRLRTFKVSRGSRFCEKTGNILGPASRRPSGSSDLSESRAAPPSGVAEVSAGQ